MDYVNTFLKIKQVAIGVPLDCLNPDGTVNEQLIDQFIRGYLDHEGIQLDRENLVRKPSLQTIAKAILNFLWSKFSQNENNSTVNIASFINSYAWLCLFELLNKL